jgi:hypothetical protein
VALPLMAPAQEGPGRGGSAAGIWRGPERHRQMAGDIDGRITRRGQEAGPADTISSA